MVRVIESWEDGEGEDDEYWEFRDIRDTVDGKAFLSSASGSGSAFIASIATRSREESPSGVFGGTEGERGQ